MDVQVRQHQCLLFFGVQSVADVPSVRETLRGVRVCACVCACDFLRTDFGQSIHVIPLSSSPSSSSSAVLNASHSRLSVLHVPAGLIRTWTVCPLVTPHLRGVGIILLFSDAFRRYVYCTFSINCSERSVFGPK